MQALVLTHAHGTGSIEFEICVPFQLGGYHEDMHVIYHLWLDTEG